MVNNKSVTPIKCINKEVWSADLQVELFLMITPSFPERDKYMNRLGDLKLSIGSMAA